MEGLAAIVAALLTTLGTIGGIYLTARRYGKLGVAPAQLLLADTQQKTITAQATEIGTLRRQLDDAETQLLEATGELRTCERRRVVLERIVAEYEIERHAAR